jgi:hypothetical protein
MHGSAGSLRCLGQVVLEALFAIEALTTPMEKLRMTVESRADGRLCCRLYGGTARESTVFLDALAELTDPIDNPRYLLLRSRDAFPVPRLFAMKKEAAELFAAAWRRHIGTAALIYTRTREGRAALLAARARSVFVLGGERGVRESVWGR